MSDPILPGLVLSDLAGVATQQVQVSPELAAVAAPAGRVEPIKPSAKVAA